MADPKIKYDISANVSGDADVEKLASEIERLGKTLDGDLKVKADQAANALRELGNKNQAAANFFDLKQKTLDAAKALGEAQTAAQAMAREIAQSDAPTKTQAAQLEKLKDAVKAANTEYLNSQNALTQARSALGNYGLSVDGLAKNQQVLKRELAQAKEAAASLSGELAQQAAAQRSAEQAAKEQAAALKQANTAAREAATAAKEASTATSGWAASIGKIAAGNVLANVFSAITSKVQETGRAFVEANIQLDGMRRAMTAIYGSAGVAEQQISFLRKTSNEAGVSFAALGDSFKSFAAASHAANIPISVTNELFASVTKASATLGLSGERTSLVLQALGQMASKGTVSMEELRQQLGESLPGALSLAAKGLGLTEQQLIKLVESGGLAARDLFPALAESLKSMQGANDGLQGSWERLKTSLNGVMTAIGDAGGMQVMTFAVKALAVALGVLLVPLQAAVEMFLGLGRVIGGVVASIVILADASTTSAQKIAALKEVANGVKDSFDAADARLQGTANSLVGVATGADAASTSLANTGAVASSTNAAFAQYSQQWVGIGQAMRDAAKEQQNAAENATKHAQAVKDDGAALIELARIRGDANLLADAEATAAQNTLTALQAVATARGQQLEIVQAELTAKQNLIAGNEVEQKARAQEIKDLTDKVNKLKEEAGASEAAAQAARVDAEAKRLAAQANKDHSAQVVELTKAIQDQQQIVKDLERLNAQGKATDERLAEAKRKLAENYYLLNDALSDNVKLMNAYLSTAQQDADTTRTLLQADMERAKVAEQRARLMNDEYGVRQAILKQKEIELAMAKAEIHANETLAMAKIATLNAQREELTASGQLTDAKKLEIESNIRAAEAQIMLAKARGESVKLMEEEIQKLKSGVTNVKEYESRVKDAAATTRTATGGMGRGWDGVAGSIGNATQKAKEYADYQKRMDDKYGRAGQGKAEQEAEADRKRAQEKKDADYMASRFDPGLAKDMDGKVVGSVESEAQMNQRIAKLFGEGAIGMKEAIEAANIKIKLDEAAKYGVANVPGNQEFYTNLKREFDRLSAIVNDSGRGGNGAAVGKKKQQQEIEKPRSGGGMSATNQGASYTQNITLPSGEQTQARYADYESMKGMEQLLRQLQQGKGAS